MALGPVAEAFGVHEISRFTTVQSSSENVPAALSILEIALPAVALPDAPAPFIGPEPAASANRVVQGAQLLSQLALLSPGALEAFLVGNPASIQQLLAHPPAARDVSVWWGGLDPNLRGTLSTTAPELVGNLDGVPFATRDQANRKLLQQTMQQLRAAIDGQAGRTMVGDARRQLKMLESIDAALDAASEPRRTLMSLDVEGQGRAAIVLGDLRTADYVSYLVPGMFFTIENQMGDWADAASRLYDEQLEWLDLFGAAEADSADSNKTVATIAWIGYHTPNLTNVGGIDNAYGGRDSLARAIEGLQAVRAGNQPYVSVIAHSYGSTAALMALTEYDFDIDALALVGSPGSTAKSVDDLHVRDGNVYVGEAPWDPVPNSSFFGSDPGSASYGAKPMGVAGGVDVITDQRLLGSSGHNEYFSPGTESMRNFALIAIGKGEFVSDGSASDSGKTLALLH